MISMSTDFVPPNISLPEPLFAQSFSHRSEKHHRDRVLARKYSSTLSFSKETSSARWVRIPARGSRILRMRWERGGPETATHCISIQNTHLACHFSFVFVSRSFRIEETSRAEEKTVKETWSPIGYEETGTFTDDYIEICSPPPSCKLIPLWAARTHSRLFFA